MLHSVEDMADNIVGFYRCASDHDRAVGRVWYPSAQEWASNVAARTGLSMPQVAAVIAALSPQMEWSVNLDATHRVVSAWVRGEPIPRVGLGNSVRRAALALAGDLSDIERSKGTRKVHNFYHCILGTPGAVTIDRHALRVAVGDINHSPNAKISDRQYDLAAEAYRVAARRIGLGVRHVQAITWETCRRMRAGLVVPS